jgi:two-component system, chemotaxis family, CheB/CheR fusion protein
VRHGRGHSLQASDLESARELRSLGMRTYAGFPLVASGRVVATASFATAQRTAFEPDEIALMQTVCDLVSAALARDELGEALADREALYRTLAEAMPHIVYTTGPDGETDYVNSRWFEYAGLDIATAPRFAWIDRIHSDDRERTHQAWRSALSTGAEFTSEFRFRRGDGEYRWHSGRALPVRNDAGEVARWIGTCTDVHDVTLATAALKDADRRKDEFLATLAHELRNPLSPMRIAVTLLGRREGEDAELSRLRLVIERQVDHLTRLVDDLLDVSRITRDKLTLLAEWRPGRSRFQRTAGGRAY